MKKCGKNQKKIPLPCGLPPQGKKYRFLLMLFFMFFLSAPFARLHGKKVIALCF
jgi:hypothetical protein